MMKKYSEKDVFAQYLSDDELEEISGGLCGLNGSGGDDCSWTQYENKNMCTSYERRDIRLYGFPNCAATVESGSWCWSNDACLGSQVVYYDMHSCTKAWE